MPPTSPDSWSYRPTRAERRHGSDRRRHDCTQTNARGCRHEHEHGHGSHAGSCNHTSNSVPCTMCPCTMQVALYSDASGARAPRGGVRRGNMCNMCACAHSNSILGYPPTDVTLSILSRCTRSARDSTCDCLASSKAGFTIICRCQCAVKSSRSTHVFILNAPRSALTRPP